ncbi:hypothetical protein Q7O44_16210 [Shigella flexneri]|nr:hypothetical protein [Shigella flexneri]
MVRQPLLIAGQYHHQNPHIGAHFGVKTLEEEMATRWRTDNDERERTNDICFRDATDNVRRNSGIHVINEIVYLGDNWYKINDYLAAKVLLQVKGSSPTAVPFENVGTGADTRWYLRSRRSMLAAYGASGLVAFP